MGIQQSRTIKKNKGIAFMLIAAFGVCFIVGSTGCSSNKLDTDENRELIESHDIFSLELKDNNLSKHIEGSWIAVQPYYDENNSEHWSIISCSESSLSESVLSEIDILAVVRSAQTSAQYKSSSGQTTGTSEYAYVYYYDAKTGDCYGSEMISAGALPNAASFTPHYTISNKEMCDVIKKRLSSRIDPDYDTDSFTVSGTVLQAVNIENARIVALPEYITEVSTAAGNDFLQIKGLSEIEFPEDTDKIDLSDLQADVALGVYAGSYAEQYAIENGYVYYHLGTLDGFLPEGVYEYDKVSYSRGSYDYLHIPSSVTYIRDGVFSTNNAVFVVHEDSYAEQAAKESEHVYCYEGQTEQVYVPEGTEYFFIPQEVVELTSIIHLPESLGSISEQMDGYLTDNASHLLLSVFKGSYAESYAQEKGMRITYE